MGMNINGSTALQVFNFTSNYRGSTNNGTFSSNGWNNTSRDITNFTASTYNASNKTWPMHTFCATAVPLAVGTIFVPLIAGSVFRWTVLTAIRYRTPLQTLLMFLIVPAIWAVYSFDNELYSIVSVWLFIYSLRKTIRAFQA